MSWYNKLRYHIAPPVFVVVFTSSVQLLALSGRDEDITLLALASGICGNAFSWTIVSTFIMWAWVWLIIPRKQIYGPTTSYGCTPIYKGRGFVYYWVSVVAYICCELWHPGLSTLIYRNMPEILGSLNIVAISLCAYLYFRPSPVPQIDELPRLYSFYKGRDLHPRLLGVDVKQLTNCRIGLMAWQILVLSFFIASLDLNGYNFPTLVTCLLQSIYLAKFFYWERGYFNTLDMTLDRAGYYICWGCLVWVPCFYTHTSYYLVSHVPVITNSSAFYIALFGTASIFANYWVDAQKLRFRSCPDGRCVIWGNPAKFLRAKYTDSSGRDRCALLLTSGLWGVARHLNYTFEIALSIFWCLPGLGLGLHPFYYSFFIVILLLHRIYRDEEKCRNKYGQYWKEYCDKVPYRLIPNIF